MATQHKQGGQGGRQQGNVKDPQHDGRLKENREAGRTMGTTPGSEARAHEKGHEPASSSHEASRGDERRHGSSHESGHSSASASGRGESGSDDLKSREYRGDDGQIHHHTRTYEEQHRGGKK